VGLATGEGGVDGFLSVDPRHLHRHGHTSRSRHFILSDRYTPPSRSESELFLRKGDHYSRHCALRGRSPLEPRQWLR
jgi:hypothetical protein